MGEKTFKDFYLEERLLKAIASCGWKKPTQIQESVIPLVLEEKNIIARAHTGTGKTGAFLLPLIQKIVQATSAKADESSGVCAVIIVPTKELSAQIFNLLCKLISTFPFIQAGNLAELNDEKQKIFLENEYDIIVSTPSRLTSALVLKPNLLQNVCYVVLDEADLLFTFGYKEDLKLIKKKLPKKYQTIMTSATITDDLTEIKQLLLTGPVISIKLKEDILPSSEQLTQYQINCATEEEKFTVVISMLKLKLMQGKTIFFVSNVDRCYKLQIFLQCFKISSCVLNPEMPANSRFNTIQKFNEGQFNYIIATDCKDLSEPEIDEDKPKKPKKAKKEKGISGAKYDNESGVSRGIDFHHVSNVVNFDFPHNLDVYIHRVGRTARGFNKGTAITFVLPEEKTMFDGILNEISECMGENVIVPYEIRMKDLETFLLRTREALSGCTRGVIRETRLAEIKKEILNSKKLENYFSQNSKDLAIIEQNKSLRKVKVQTETLHAITDYMVPPALRGLNLESSTFEHSNTKHKNDISGIKSSFRNKGKKRKFSKVGKKKVDPLAF
ncbi:Probable ATP-dependent RNA helicase DDX56 [Strongyloides ratti]|uniref:RNA helicase n=1 Tax=Strongyloides ratti TaxID=34506 RepID=A0A090L6J7_STRRB|nr:Probable ATP-dependent RNA helicase DDX56 [Strongyloides ratti]CEF63124.1 Probable ATP-dependent RNA helicase DDX56 [Strongyloides ratti]